MIKKICSGCGKVIEYTRGKCPECEAKVISRRNKAYNEVLRNKDHDQVYRDIRWRKIKPVVHMRDAGKCRLCFDNQTLTYLQLVHHIVEPEYDMGIAYDPSNLISLCEACHQRVHVIYDTGDKMEMQNKLREIINKPMKI